MADLVGAEVDIPKDAWEPQAATNTRGIIRKFQRPTKKFPHGRLAVYIPADKDTFVWPTEKLPRSWIIPSTLPSAQPGSPSAARSVCRMPAEAPQPEARATRSRATAITPKRRSDTYAGSDFSGGDSSDNDEPTTNSCRSKAPLRHRLTNEVSGPASSSATQQPRQGLIARSPPTHQTGSGGDVGTDDEGHDEHAHVEPVVAARYAANLALLVAVALPAIFYGVKLSTGGCTHHQMDAPLGPWGPQRVSDLLTWRFWCALGAQRPVAAVFLVFTLNVDVLFWVISLIQGSTWLIDPYWTLIPPLIGLFYQHNPSTVTNAWRSWVVTALLWTWSARLTHSYFRREEWSLGSREDWRFTELKKQVGKHWWWMSFFTVYVSQQLMLVGFTLPLWAVHASRAPWGALDTIATIGAVAGLIIAYFADTQLRSFMIANKTLKDAGKPTMPVLATGLWHYSRHPNYFGEQLWWWSLALFGVRVGHGWTTIGTLFNTLCLVQVTVMTEKRMAERPERRAAFKEYQRTTSVWVPWFKFA